MNMSNILIAAKTQIVMGMTPYFAAAGGVGADLSIFTTMMDIFAKGIVALGGLYCVIGLLSIGRGYREHGGVDMNTGVNQLVSGGVYLMAAVVVKTISLV